MKKFLTGLFALGITLGVSASAGDGSEVWTYGECVEYALSHNITLRQSLLSAEITDQNLAEAEAQWQPSLDFSTTHSFTNTPWGEAKKNSYVGNFSLGASWTVWNGGIRENNIRLQKLQREADNLSAEDIARTIKVQLLSAYLNILYSEESARIYENALRLSTATAERAYELWQAGKLSRVDWAQLKSQQEQDNYSLVNARGEYASRCLDLKNLLQIGIDRNIVPTAADFSDEAITAPLPPLEDTYRLACEQDPVLSSLALKKDMADVSLRIAKGGKMPSIGLSAGVGTGYSIPRDNVGDQLRRSLNEQIGLSLNLPLFDRRSAKTAIEKAKLEQIGAGYDTDARYQELARTVEQWYIDTSEACSRFHAAVAREEAARLSDELVNEQFSLGLVNTVELLTAHNTLLDAAHSTLQAKYLALLGQKMIQYYRTSEIHL